MPPDTIVKAAEVLAWIECVIGDEGTVGMIDVRAYVEKKWPSLAPDIHERIADIAWRSAVAAFNK